MATRDEIYNAIRNADKAGDTESVKKLAAYLETMPQDAAAPVEPQGKLESLAAGAGKGFGQVMLNLQKFAGKGVEKLGGAGQEKNLTSLIVPTQGNLVQRAGQWLQKDADAGLSKIAQEVAPYKAANPNITGAGEIGGNIVATAPVGGVLASVLKKLGVGLVAPGLVNSVRTGGMTTGLPAAPLMSAAGATNALTRAAGGAITGGASSALVNPDDAGTGAAVGAVLPGALQVAGKVGSAIGRAIRGPEQASDLAQAIQSARSAGYVIPPTQANPTFANRLMEGFSGKITTAQNASAKNQAVTNAKAAQALGLDAETKITSDVLKQVRDQAGQAYEAVAGAGIIQPGKEYAAALDKIAAPFIKTSQSFPNAKPSPVLDLVESLKSPSFDAAAAVEKVKQLRSAADDAFRSGGPGATDLARASRSAASALEDALEQHLEKIGQPELLQSLREGRKLIAKTYTVEKALNPTTGTVDARKLATALQKGKPLSGELKEAAEFAARFPKASQAVEGMGSLPQTSPLDWALGAGMSASTANPLMLASVMARPMARKAVLSPMIQDRLIQQPNSLQMLTVPESVRQLGYRAAPVIASDR